MLSFVVLTKTAKLYCEYNREIQPKLRYECVGSIVATTPNDSLVENVTGKHLYGMCDDNVTTVTFFKDPVKAIPKGLKKFFKNFSEFYLIDIEDLPNFSRKDFNDLTQLKVFFAANLSKTTNIPRDAFWDLRNLTYLKLFRMSNMKNLHEDLLINAPNLIYFSAQGPNKINQINPGFFRNQVANLLSVDFRDTNLMRIGYSAFNFLVNLKVGFFMNAGCLNNIYHQDVAKLLTADIRKRCKNVEEGKNDIMKRKYFKSFSSEASSTSSIEDNS